MQQLVSRGYDYYNNRNYIKALECAELAIEKNRDDENAWLLKGIALRETNHPLKAITCFDKSIKLDRTFFEAYIENADVHLALGNYKKAEEYANKALSIHQKSRNAISAWRCKGFIAYSEGNYSDSFSHYNKSKTIAETYRKKADDTKDVEGFSIIWHMLGAVSFQRTEKVYYLDDALSYFIEAYDLNKKNALPLLGMSNVFKQEKYYNKELADAKISEALKIDSNLVYASWIQDGVDLAQEGKYVESEKCFNKAIEPDSCHRSLAKINKGLICLKHKDYRNAKNYFDSALNEESNYSALALVCKSFALGNLNELNEAKECFNKAMKADPDLECAKSKDLIYKSVCGFLLFFRGYDLSFVEEVINDCQKKINDQNFESSVNDGLQPNAANNERDVFVNKYNRQKPSDEELSECKMVAYENGVIGKTYINDYLTNLKLKAEIKDFRWISKDNRFAPYDFSIIDKIGKEILLDVKSTNSEFNQKFFISYNEITKMAQKEKRYDIYRVYRIESSAMLRICIDVGAFSRNVLEILDRLPDGIIADSVTVSPSSLKFGEEIKLFGYRGEPYKR